MAARVARHWLLNDVLRYRALVQENRRGPGARPAPARDDVRIAAAASSDAAAFRDLLEHHRRLIEAAVMVAGLSGPDRLDALQEARLALWRGLPSYRGEAALSTWVYVVAKRAAMRLAEHHVRCAGPAVSTPEEEIDLRVADEGARVELRTVLDALAQLDETPREVLVLYAFGGRTHQEIAGLLGIAEGTSKSHLSRARATLGQLLDGVHP